MVANLLVCKPDIGARNQAADSTRDIINFTRGGCMQQAGACMCMSVCMHVCAHVGVL